MCPWRPGESLGTGVHRLSALLRTRALVDEALAPQFEPVVLIGGDCGVSIGAIAHAARAHDDLAVVWFDAHPDLHDPDSRPPARSAAWCCAPCSATASTGSRSSRAVPPSASCSPGARSFDDAEQDYAAGARADRAGRRGARATGRPRGGGRVHRRGSVFVHVDLDVLDPSEISGVTSAQPFGVSLADLLASIARRSAREVPLVGAAITRVLPVVPGGGHR